MCRTFLTFLIVASVISVCLTVGSSARAGADYVQYFHKQLEAYVPPVPPIEPIEPFDPDDLDALKRYQMELQKYAMELKKYEMETAKFEDTWIDFIGSRLTTVSQLSRAYRPEQIAVLKRYPLLFDEVRARLIEEIRRVAAKGSPQAKRATAILIGEMAASGVPENIHLARHDLWPSLEALGRDGNAEVRTTALQAMGQMLPHTRKRKADDGPNFGTTIIPVLWERLAKGSLAEKRVAARSLGELMDNVNKIVLQVGQATEEDLTDYRNTNHDVILAAAAGLQADDQQTRLSSLAALEQATVLLIRDPGKLHFVADAWNQVLSSRAFGDRLMDSDARVRWIARDILEKISEAYKKERETPKLQEVSAPLQSQRWLADYRRNGAALLNVELARFQPAPKDAEVEFQKLLLQRADAVARTLNDPDVRNRLAGVHFLETLSALHVGMPVVEALLARTHDPDPFVRWAAARTLGQIGQRRLEKWQPKDKAAEEELLARMVKAIADLTTPLHERDIDVRAQAARSLRDIAGQAKADLQPPPQWTSIIVANSSRQLTAAATMARLDPPFPAWITTEPIIYRDSEPRVQALLALRIIVGGPKLRELPEVKEATVQTTQALIPLLRDPDQRIRQAAAETLGSCGPAARAAVPALEQALHDPVGIVRRAASEALLNINTK